MITQIKLIKYCLSITALFALLSCGGGSSSSSTSSSPSSAPSLTGVKIKNAYIDARFEMPGNAASNVNPQLDIFKALGYNAVTFGVEVPIDVRTGQVNTSNGMGLPTDLWIEVNYARSIGLNVFIKCYISRAFNLDGSRDTSDADITSNIQLGPGVTIDQVFSSAAAYEKTIAAQAQAHGVSAFYIGSNNFGYDSGNYASYWQALINSVQSVYKGPLGYYALYDNIVFSMVNLVEFKVNPIISNSPLYDVASIVNGYATAQYYSSGISYLQQINNMITKYAGKIFLLAYSADAFTQGVGTTTGAWELLLSNPSSLFNYSPNNPQQAASYQAAIQVAKNVNANGITIYEYDPWAATQTSPAWRQYDLLGSDLWFKPTVNAAISSYFKTIGW